MINVKQSVVIALSATAMGGIIYAVNKAVLCRKSKKSVAESDEKNESVNEEKTEE